MIPTDNPHQKAWPRTSAAFLGKSEFLDLTEGGLRTWFTSDVTADRLGAWGAGGPL